MAAAASAVVPGIGQLLNGRRRLGRRFLLPSLVALALVWLVLQLVPGAVLFATIVNPVMLTLLIGLNFVVLVWRLAAVAQAFFDTRFPSRPSRRAAIGLVALAIVVGLPHGFATAYALDARDTVTTVFAGDVRGQQGPGGNGGDDNGPPNGTPVVVAPSERINVLLIGLDRAPWRTATLTDTMMVVSLDPVGRTVSMLSIPRDTVNVPLPDGTIYAPKLNSLWSHADRNPDEFPQGGTKALMEAIGSLLGIPIHYHATVDFAGFMTMVDAVGGVEVQVSRGFSDPTYELWQDQYGWSISAGRHHLDGREALAYARARKAEGESDFTRAARQQQLIVALRNKVTSTGTLVSSLPRLLDALEDTVVTDVPIGRLPELAAIVDEVSNDALVRVVLRHPLVRGTRNGYGSVQVPDVEAIRAMAAQLFSQPGTPPTPWPTPKPTVAPSAAPGSAAS